MLETQPHYLFILRPSAISILLLRIYSNLPTISFSRREIHFHPNDFLENGNNWPVCYWDLFWPLDSRQLDISVRAISLCFPFDKKNSFFPHQLIGETHLLCARGTSGSKRHDTCSVPTTTSPTQRLLPNTLTI